MRKHLLVQIVWNLSRKINREVDDFLRSERLEVWFGTAECQLCSHHISDVETDLELFKS